MTVQTVEAKNTAIIVINVAHLVASLYIPMIYNITVFITLTMINSLLFHDICEEYMISGRLSHRKDLLIVLWGG